MGSHFGFKRGALAALLCFPSLLPSAATPMRWIPEGGVNALAVANNTTYVGGSFRFFAPYVGSGAIVDPGSAANLSAPLNINANVSAAVADGVGGWYIGGAFTQVAGIKRLGLAHLYASGAVDPGFNPNALVYANCLSLYNGVLYVGGSILPFDGRSLRSLAAFDASGTMLGWSPDVSKAGLETYVSALAVNNGLVYVAGDYDSIGGQARLDLAAVDLSGTVQAWDAAIQPGSCGYDVVTSLTSAAGLLYVGGCFDAIGGQARTSAAAFDASGALTAWSPALADSYSHPQVYALCTGANAAFFTGNFDQVGGAPAQDLAQVDLATGAPNSAFNAQQSFNDLGSSLCVYGGNLYAASWGTGHFSSPSMGYGSSYNVSSGLKTAWDPKATGEIYTLCPSGGRVFVGGYFQGLGTNAVPRASLAAIDAGGNLLAWAPSLTLTSVADYPQVSALAVTGTTVYACGNFDGTVGFHQPGLLALDGSSGAPLTGFNPGAIYSYGCLTVGGGILYNGGYNGLVALDAASGQTQFFSASYDGYLNALALGNGKLYLAGNFQHLDGAPRGSLGAVDAASGALDALDPVTFTPSANGYFSGVQALLPYGTDLFIGGGFIAVNGVPRAAVARLDAGGAATAWDAGIDSNGSGTVSQLLLLGGQLLLGGSFGSVQGQWRGSFAQVDPASGSLGAWRAANAYGQAWATDGSLLYLGGETFSTDMAANQNLAILSPGPDSPPDAWETDNSPNGPNSLPLVTVNDLGGVRRGFNDAFDCNDGDDFMFDAQAGHNYSVETFNLGPGCDSILYVSSVAPSMNNEVVVVAANDDRAPGDRSSQATVHAAASQRYWVLVSSLDTQHTGAGAGYSLRVLDLAVMSPTPTQSPSPSPSPSATVTPICYAFASQWGVTGTAGGQFSNPMGIAVAGNGDVYVSDQGNTQVHHFDGQGNFINAWGGLGTAPGKFSGPNQMAWSGLGRLYVCDANNHRVQVFDGQGNSLGGFGALGSGAGQFQLPYGVAVSPDGLTVYVADATLGRIQAFDDNGTYQSSFTPSGAGQLRSPEGLALGGNGLLYVDDLVNSRVAVFDTAGNFKGSIGGPGSLPGQFRSSVGIAVDASGEVWTADLLLNLVQRFDPGGALDGSFGSAGAGHGQFNQCRNLALAPDGDLYVVDRANHLIQRFSCAGVTPSPSPTASATPSLAPTATASATPSPSASPTGTPSPTSTPTASPTATDSPSPSATASPTPTASPSPSASPSPTATPSITASNTATASPSPTPSATDSMSASPSASATASPCATASPSISPTFSASPSATVSPTASPSPSVSPTATVSPSPGPTPADDPQVLGLVAVPQPNPRALGVLLDAGAESVRVRIYSSAYVRCAQWDASDLLPGWNRLPLPAAVAALPSGVYYAQVSASGRHHEFSKPKLGPLVLLH